MKTILLFLILTASGNLLANAFPSNLRLHSKNFDFNLEFQAAIDLGDYDKSAFLINQNPEIDAESIKHMLASAQGTKETDEEILKNLEVRSRWLSFLKNIDKPIIFLASGIAAFGLGWKVSKYFERENLVMIESIIGSHEKRTGNAVNRAATIVNFFNLHPFHKNNLFITCSIVGTVLSISSMYALWDKSTILDTKLAQETSNIKFIKKHIENIDKIIKLLMEKTGQN